LITHQTNQLLRLKSLRQQLMMHPFVALLPIAEFMMQRALQACSLAVVAS